MKVDATATREHLLGLLAFGCSVRGIARAADVDARFVGRLTVPTASARPKGAVYALDADRATRLLAVTVESANEADGLTQIERDMAARKRASATRTAPESPVTPRPRSRREAVDCVVDLAKIHALPLDHFVARQLDITLGAAQDLLREARRDGLVPAITRAKGRR